MTLLAKRFGPWLLVSLLSILIFIRDQVSGESEMRRSLSDAVAISGAPLNGIARMVGLWAENRLLRQQLTQLAFEATQIEDIRRENERLRALLDFRQRSQFDLVPALVVGATSDAGIVGIIIDRGAEQGLRQNMAVVSAHGLVGRIYRMSGSSATVQLVSDPKFGVAARLASGGVGGILHALGSGRLRLDGVPLSAEPAAGDSVITSGAGGIFPPGLMIGHAVSVRPSPEGWLMNIEVEPTVDYSRVGEVFVVRQTSP
ncbi:MAG: rod shape-determining protein MreC [Calditrichaeota bacterium]|nr:rod shape-determining protein MreC [Calditrichota bacterium]